MTAAERDRAPVGFDQAYWNRFIADLDVIADRARYGSDVAELVQLARSPLPPLDPSPGPPRRRVKKRGRTLPPKIIVPRPLLDEISAHAASVEPGYEAGGRLTVAAVDGVATAYHRLPNHATEPGRVVFRSS